MEITAFVIGRAFVSEEGPDRWVTVEIKDKVRPQPLKEGGLFRASKCLQSCLWRQSAPRGCRLTAENLDSVGEKSQEVFVPHRLVRRVFGQRGRKTRRQQHRGGKHDPVNRRTENFNDT